MVNYTGTKSVFVGAPSGGERRDMQLTPPGGGKAFEVVGIPLTEKGFHVVEIASPELGAALLGRKSTRYVARSEEHTSELQSLMRISYAVFCLKKKNKNVRFYIVKTRKTNSPLNHTS